MKINLVYLISIAICASALMAANSQPKLPYTPYEILMWEIKANEGYSPHWYKDGFVNGKQSYSIGFGWNDQGSSERRKEIAQYTRDGSVSYDEAGKITLYEIKKYGRLHPGDLKNTAMQLYSYSRGLTKNINRLGGCCTWKNGCGSKTKWVKKAHNRRRALEMALVHHDNRKIIEMTEENKVKIQKIRMSL